jgi:Phage tail protein (Tail_P2_I)
MPELDLQPSIASDLRSQAALRLSKRLSAPVRDDMGNVDSAYPGRIDVTPILVYWIDRVPASALPYLLWQFDVASSMWALIAPRGSTPAASATAARRALIKQAISLHAVRGTPYAITTALTALGWPATLLEGQEAWGGSAWPADQGWATCRIVVDLAFPPQPLDGVPTWDPLATYQAGDLVVYEGSYWVASTNPELGVPPFYDIIGQIPDIALIADMHTLRTIFWQAPPSIDGIPYRLLRSQDVALITAAFAFFKRAAVWLDRIVGLVPAHTDGIVPAFSDSLDLVPTDRLSPAISDTLRVEWPVSEDAITFVPLHDGRYRRAGITYSGQPIRVSDGVIVVNGVAVEGNA